MLLLLAQEVKASFDELDGDRDGCLTHLEVVRLVRRFLKGEQRGREPPVQIKIRARVRIGIGAAEGYALQAHGYARYSMWRCDGAAVPWKERGEKGCSQLRP